MLAERIRAAFAHHDIAIAALSGTFNMIDPDEARRREQIERFPILLEWCRALGCGVVTACTGTRNAASMWRSHPDNARPEAWRDLRASLSQLLPLAEAQDITVAFEPEVVNVVDSAEKAERLIEEAGSARLRLVMDPANYFHPPMLERMDAVLEEVFARVGRYIALAHAKDVRGPNPGGTECVRPAAGTGVLNYALYLRLLRASGYDGALIMHSLSEAEVPASAAYVRAHLARVG
jgi:sugar phosphate isomerase/epimerase